MFLSKFVWIILAGACAAGAAFNFAGGTRTDACPRNCGCDACAENCGACCGADCNACCGDNKCDMAGTKPQAKAAADKCCAAGLTAAATAKPAEPCKADCGCADCAKDCRACCGADCNACCGDNKCDMNGPTKG